LPPQRSSKSPQCSASEGWSQVRGVQQLVAPQRTLPPQPSANTPHSSLAHTRGVQHWFS
jgi:hypothetical protein